MLALPEELFIWLKPISTSYLLIIAAEIGDKSQLVCMTLAAKYRATPVILGASLAFMLLNTLAVVFGVGIAHWLPDTVVTASVCVLFMFFGLQSLFFNEEEDDATHHEKSSHNLFFSTFLLIAVAEFGDKTQLAVVALSSSSIPIAVWIGASLALISTTLLGVLAGRTVLQKIPLKRIHQLSGVFFMLLALLSGYTLLRDLQLFPQLTLI